MNKGLRLGGLALITGTLLLFSGCAPVTDTTDPLSDYSVNVNVPFATTSAAYQTLPATQQKYTIRPGVAETIVGWLNESLDASVKEKYTSLALGSLGTNVKNLQKRLIELGYMTGTASGTYDQATAQAVRLFENAYGQVETGIASQLMQVYLFSDNAKTYSESKYQATATQAASAYSTLQKGDMGAAVLNLQNRLIELGYLSGSATGIYDVNTENAVKDFEAAYNRSRTGIATASMQSYLFSKDAYPAGRVTPTPTPFTVTPKPNTNTGYPALQYGSKGDAVKNLQTRLKFLGYYTGKVDGVYGNGTVNAIKAFESAYGKEQTGIASSALQAVLFADDAMTYQEAMNKPTPTPVAYQTLAKGSYGDAVAKLQARLIELKYLSGKADGYFGENTEKAVKAFEARYGYMQTGVATPDMQRVLFSSGALKNSSQSAQQTEYTTLGEGSYGTQVYALEVRLAELKYMASEPDGYYDSETANAVRMFESANGRTQTGVATVDLQELLYSSKAKSNPNAVVAGAYRTLRNGDKNEDVVKLQKRLIELGYLTGTADGYYGDGTEAAVRAFEAAYGRDQTGIATELLQTYLFSKDAKANTNSDVAVSYTTLESGDSGQAVKDLQKRLIELGYLKGTADGKYGSGTANAVKAFQKALGLKQTGVASASLQKEIYAVTAPVYTETPSSSGTVQTVNKPAYITSDQAAVYARPDASSQVLGKMSAGSQVTWLRTNGDWAEVQNSKGDIGYLYTKYLALSNASSSVQSYPDLKTGNTGENVKNLQRRLKELGYFSGDIGGNYLNKTTAAVKAFQKAIGVSQSGNASADLQEILFSNAAPRSGAYEAPAAQAYQTMTPGASGDKVGELQLRLVALGYLNSAGANYGSYDAATRQAVMDVQTAMGYRNVSGIASPELQAFLASDAAESIHR